MEGLEIEIVFVEEKRQEWGHQQAAMIVWDLNKRRRKFQGHIKRT